MNSVHVTLRHRHTEFQVKTEDNYESTPWTAVSEKLATIDAKVHPLLFLVQLMRENDLACNILFAAIENQSPLYIDGISVDLSDLSDFWDRRVNAEEQQHRLNDVLCASGDVLNRSRQRL